MRLICIPISAARAFIFWCSSSWETTLLPDKMLMAFVYPLQGPALAKALRDNGVPNRVQVYDDAKHGVGIGVGTDAEGWVADAAAFWKSVSEE